MPEDAKRDRLPPGQQLVACERWPLVGERLPRPSDSPWSLQIAGQVQCEINYSLPELKRLRQTEITTDIHCVTRWSKFDVRFCGVLLKDLIRAAQPKSNAKFVSLIARSERNHSSSLPLDEAIRLGTLMAHSCNDAPLPVEHGGPLRGIVPGKYFYKSVKWVESIMLLEHDRLGFWESDSGYHNEADPWREQRYIASSISKRDAARLIETKNFSNQDLLGLDAAGRILTRLDAKNAILRNANFSESDLTGSDFRRANLSNASFRSANLVGADFSGADLEGADFAGADLRGANFTGCSLFGTTFCDCPSAPPLTNGAIFNDETKLPRSQLEGLTQMQRDFVLRWLNAQV